jgi:ribonuclease Z
MFALTFLGTSASVPSADRNHPGILVEAGSQRILVDCGEGTQRQLLRSGAGFRRLDRILLTHGHFDHVLGIPGLFSTLRLRQSADEMTIHGSPGTLDVVVRMLAGLWGEGRAPIPLRLVPLTWGQVLDAGDFTIDCFSVRHRDTDSFAFSSESRTRHLRADRLAALGVPDGPVRKELAEGKPVTLANGRTIDPEDVLGPPQGRKKLVIVGDTEATEGLAEHVRDADVLVIEATFLDRDAAIARDYGHLTAAEVAALAAMSDVKLLVLTHISGRYTDEEILTEAGKTFPPGCDRFRPHRDLTGRAGGARMARKLKTYQTSLGFFDLAVAAPSMKAALEAWGADSNLFHQGAAKESEDADVIAATMAAPGVVLKRPVGSSGPFKEHAEPPTDLGGDDGSKKAGRKSTTRKPQKHPKRTSDQEADRKAALAFEKEQKRGERERAKEEAARLKERERRQRAVDKAQSALDAARRKQRTFELSSRLLRKERRPKKCAGKRKRPGWKRCCDGREVKGLREDAKD